MAIYKTSGLLLTISSTQLNTLIKHFIESDLSIEFLNPAELGEEWNNIEYVILNTDKEIADLNILHNLFKLYPPKGFWSKFEDTRSEFSSKELKTILTSRADLVYIAEKILLLKENQRNVAQLSKGKKKKVKNEQQIKLLELQINNIYKDLGVNDKKIEQLIIPELKKLYSGIEIEKKIKELPKNIFKVSKSSDTFFGFIAFPQSQEDSVIKLLINLNISFKKTFWNKELVIWADNNLESFKQIPQSLGTIDKKEVDPTIIISFFFAFFFALALNDAIYGLIISLFTGYILYFKKVKPNLKNIFGLLFVSGIFTLIIGAITGSWAGNLLEKTPVYDILSNFQLIKQVPNTTETDLPIINEYLNNNLDGVSPVVALLGFALIVGLIHIFTALILKTINSYKAKMMNNFKIELSWIVFLFSGICYFIIDYIYIKPFILMSLVTSLLFIFLFNSGKGIIGKIVKGLIQLYDLIAFLADILSYTRLIAIGLTGAIIADVINLLAELAYNASPPFIGTILFLAIVIIGHIFNLIVGLFGAYINPLRLHYVEFLPKFYQGKARQLKAIDTQLTYAIIKN